MDHKPSFKLYVFYFRLKWSRCLVAAIGTLRIVTQWHAIQGTHVTLMPVTQDLHIIHMPVAIGSNISLFSSTIVHGFLVHRVERHVVEHGILTVITGFTPVHPKRKNALPKICHLISNRCLNLMNIRQIFSDLQGPHPSNMENIKTRWSIKVYFHNNNPYN